MPLTSLAPDAVQHFTDSSGNLLAGGLLYTYAAGTMTKLATYTDASGATPNTNPIILNSRGECGLWLTQGTPYKLILSPAGDTDPPSNPIWTVDNIISSNGPLAAPTSVTVPGTGTLALTASQLNYGLIKLQGTLTGNLTVTIPAGTTGEWTFFNQTTGAYNITVTTTAASVSGTSSGSNIATTLNDTTKAWTTNAFSSGSVSITGGTGSGQTRQVLTNSATQLVVSSAWTTIPDATSTYTVSYSTVTLPQGLPDAIACDGASVLPGVAIPSNWKTANPQFYLPAAAGLGTTAVVGGTITNNDTVSLTATGSFTGSPVTVTYTVHTADNLSTIAAGLVALVNASATLQAAGIRGVSSGATAYLFSPAATTNAWTKTNGATETITLTTDAAETLTVTGTPNIGSSISVTFTSSGITGSPLTISYTALSTDTLATVATALAAAINGNINLTGVGVIAFTSGAVVTIWLPTSLSCTFTTTSSATDSIVLTSATYAVGSLTAGLVAEFLATNTSVTTTPTANLDGLGAKTIQKAGTACYPGDIAAGQTYRMVYDGTYWQLFSAVGRLINDQQSPGTTLYYGTNASGTKGYFTFPSGPSGGTVTNPMSSNLVLASNSSQIQTFTPSGNNLAVVLPNATTMSIAEASEYILQNKGNYAVQVLDYGSNILGWVLPGSNITVDLISTGTSTGNWILRGSAPENEGGWYYDASKMLGTDAIYSNSGTTAKVTAFGDGYGLVTSTNSAPTTTAYVFFDGPGGVSGGAVTLPASWTSVVSALPLTSTTYIVVGSTTTAQQAAILTVNQSTLSSSTFGSPVTIASNAFAMSVMQMILMGTVYVVAMGSGSTTAYLATFTVSGSTITAGNSTSAAGCGPGTNGSNGYSLLALNATTGYVGGGGGSFARFTLSGSTLTVGTITAVSNMLCVYYVDATHIAVFYGAPNGQNNNSWSLRATIYTDGTTPSAGSSYNLNIVMLNGNNNNVEAGFLGQASNGRIYGVTTGGNTGSGSKYGGGLVFYSFLMTSSGPANIVVKPCPLPNQTLLQYSGHDSSSLYFGQSEQFVMPYNNVTNALNTNYEIRNNQVYVMSMVYSSITGSAYPTATCRKLLLSTV